MSNQEPIPKVIDSIGYLYPSMNPLKKIYRFYADGFRGMTVGRTLWLVIIIELIVMFAIIRLFFMPDILGGLDSDSDRAEAVRKAITDNRPTTTNPQTP